jgi:hypothetical protein
MKRLIFGMLAGALVCSTMASCGEKLMTDAEITAKVSELVSAQSVGVNTEADAACDAQFDARVTAEVDKMVAEAAAAAPPPAPAPVVKKKK